MDFQKIVVCVIEDNKPVNKLLSTVLTKAGFECISFFNGQDSLEWFKDNKPSAIIIDILLPDILGTQLIEQIKNMPDYDEIPKIAISGLSGNLTREKILESGFDYFISKPVNITSFPDEIEKIIKSKTKL